MEVLEPAKEQLAIDRQKRKNAIAEWIEFEIINMARASLGTWIVRKRGTPEITERREREK